MTKPYQVPNKRKAAYPIDPIFLKRWSPRAMSGEKITKKELMSLIEAARWAPSNSNGQPWHFLYAMRDTKEWKTYFDLLVEFNQMWCKNAAVLIVLISRKNFEKGDKPNRVHTFDTGSAWMSLALQARMNNLVAHGMAGFSEKKAAKNLKIPEGYEVEAMIAIGKPGEISGIHERMQKQEKPNARKPTSQIVANGKFPKSWK